MVATTTVVHNFPSDGTYIARGVSTTVTDTDTIDTGLLAVDGFIAVTNTDDSVVAFTSQSAGVVTVAVHTAGSAESSGVTVYWEAWQLTTSG